MDINNVVIILFIRKLDKAVIFIVHAMTQLTVKVYLLLLLFYYQLSNIVVVLRRTGGLLL